LYVELVEHFVEGMVHISTMADDYYRFLEKAHVLKGENTGKVYRLGDRVLVQVVKVDMERRQIDLGIAEILDSVRRSEGNRGPRRSRAEPRREASGRAATPRTAAPPRRKQRPGRKERASKRKP
jgi:ribonuclease R